MPLTRRSSVSVHRAARSAMRGISLVEAMVGIAIGLFGVAAASLLMTNQLTDNRRLLQETQLQQDLRAAMDIITRQIRRSGSEIRSIAGQNLLAGADGTGGAPPTLTAVTPSATPGAAVEVRYYLDATSTGPFRYELSNGVIKVSYGGGAPQDLTDANTIVVTNLEFTPVVFETSELPCTKLCSGPPGSDPKACWPKVQRRVIQVAVTARARNGTSGGDPSVERRMVSDVELRNDSVRFRDAVNPTLVCPS